MPFDFVRSKLASLFGMDQASQQSGNESLTYTAPKEPKKSKFLLWLADCFSQLSLAERDGFFQQNLFVCLLST